MKVETVKKILVFLTIIFLLILLCHVHSVSEHGAADHCLLCQLLADGIICTPLFQLTYAYIIIALISLILKLLFIGYRFSGRWLRAPPKTPEIQLNSE